MPSIIIPRGGQMEPTNQALDLGLVGGFVPTLGSVDGYRDLVDGFWTNQSGNASANLVTSANGRLLRSTAISNSHVGNENVSTRLSPSTGAALLFDFTILTSVTGYIRLLSAGEFFRVIRDNSDTSMRIRVGSTNESPFSISEAFFVGDSISTNNLAVTWDALGKYVYKNGALLGASGVPPGTNKLNAEFQAVGSFGCRLGGLFLFSASLDPSVINLVDLVRPRRNVLYFDVGAVGGTTTYNLSGSAVSALASTLSAEIDVAINGVSVTTSTGTLSPAIEVTSSGSAVSVLSGSISPSLEVAISGESVATSAGTVSSGSDTVLALSGSQATSSVGPLSIAVDVALSGQSVSAETGIVGSGSDTTQALSGSSVATQSGTLAQDTDLALSGSVVEVSAGIISGIEGVERTLTGSAVTSNAGNVSESIEIALTGQNVTTESGFIGAGADVTKALTGSHVTVAQQTLYSDIAVTAVGAASTVVVGSIFGNSEVGLLGIELTPTLGAFVPNITCSMNGSQAITYTGILTGYDVLNIVRNVVARNAYVSSKVSKTSILSFKVSKGVQV